MNDDRIIDIVIILSIITIIILKITNVITISWLWLASPFILLAALGIVFCTLVTVVYLIRDIIRKIKEN